METVRVALFEERREQMHEWFEGADDFERTLIINDILARARPPQITHLRRWASRGSLPALPRAALLRVFFYLDPMSLCRASQVLLCECIMFRERRYAGSGV